MALTILQHIFSFSRGNRRERLPSRRACLPCTTPPPTSCRAGLPQATPPTAWRSQADLQPPSERAKPCYVGSPAAQGRQSDDKTPSSSAAPETPSRSTEQTSVLHKDVFQECCSCRDISEEHYPCELLHHLASEQPLFLAFCQIVLNLMLLFIIYQNLYRSS